MPSGLLNCMSPNSLTTLFYAILILGQALFTHTPLGSDDFQTKETMSLLKNFYAEKQKSADPYDFKNVDPVADNMLVFSFYKALAFVLAFSNNGSVPEYETSKVLFPLILKGLALVLQCLLVNVPLQKIIRTVYKKNSRIFQDMLTAVCVSGCMQFALCGLTVNYQAILFLGTSLWC